MTTLFESGTKGDGRSFAQGLRRAGAGALNLLFPPLCVGCRAPVFEAHSLCAACWGTIGFLDGPTCECCGYPFEIDPGPGTLCSACHANPPAFARARSVMRYDEGSKKLILALKRADRLDLAPAFSRWLDRSGRELLAEADLIVPVPLHPRRLWRRRYNQSAILAQRLAKLTAKPADPLVLRRIRATASQGEMPSAKARRRNVRGAFRVSPENAAALRGKAVLLIDDVFTTGATIDACARALKRAGATKVLVLTLARVVRPMASLI
ncbi:MAG: ComF family protein [Rhizomicrobium sp.]|jgi:ComF family protein